MSLDYRATYGAQVLSGDPGYPYGKPRNVTVSGDGTGTPWEASLVGDYFGFLQSLLVAANITPSGNADKVGASDYLAAVKYLTKHVSGELQADNFVASSGDSIGGGTNFLGATEFSQAATSFHEGWTSDKQVSVGLNGIVVGSNFVAVGNGLPGILVQVGGVRIDSGALDVNDVADFAEPVTVHDEIVLADIGRIRKRIVYGTDGNTTYSFSTADKIVARSSVISAARIYTIDEVGAGLGAEIQILNFSASILTLHNAGGGTIGTVPALGAGVPGKTTLCHIDDGTAEHWLPI